jgi:putative Holliday junction resolvase
MEKHRYLGIDYGSVRIGISLSDPLNIFAQPHNTLTNDRNAIGTIAQLVESNRITFIVIGMPLNLKGEKGGKAKEVEEFIERLHGATNATIIPWDERFTTTMAHQASISMGTKKSSRRKEKHKIDSLAATLLLQSFLDSQKRTTMCS